MRSELKCGGHLKAEVQISRLLYRAEAGRRRAKAPTLVTEQGRAVPTLFTEQRRAAPTLSVPRLSFSADTKSACSQPRRGAYTAAAKAEDQSRTLQRRAGCSPALRKKDGH